MNFNFLKLKIPAAKLPANYWNRFLWFLILVLVVVLIFDAWVFWRFFGRAQEVGTIEGGKALRLEALERALDRLEKKEANFENYKLNVPVEDPSRIE